ncbi:MutS protein msh5 [Lobulomyces angularis]|nr:MutS protein msh5 [Lobulomyces angularis]
MKYFYIILSPNENSGDADIGDEMQDHDELMNLLPIEATSYDDVKVDELSDNFVERQTGNKKDINFSEDNEITDLLEPFSTTYTRKVKIDGKYVTVPNLIFHHDNSSKYKSDSSSTIVESKTLLDPVDRKSQQENLLEYATVPSSRNVLDTLEFSSSEYSFQQIVANGHSIHKTEKVENKIQSGCSQDEDEGFSVENDEISDIERTLDSNVDCTLKSDLKLLRRKISSNAVNESPDDYSNADQIVMAISYRCRKLGCAFFNFEKNRLYLMEDVEENSQFEIVKLLIYQIQPKIIICPTKIDEKLQLLINHVSKLSQRKEISATRLQKIDEYNELTFELRPTSEFSYINGKNRLMNLKIADKDYIETSKSTYEQIFNLENGNNFKLLYLESIVSMDKQEMVGSAGALLNYIRKLKLSGIMDKRQNIEESIKRKRARYGNLDEEDVDCEDGNENNFVEGIEQFTLYN